MYTISRTLEVDAGHRLHDHEGKCRNVHGHRYKFEIFCRPQEGLDKVGRVVDFGVVKSLVGTWLDQNWDHGFLVAREDPIASYLKSVGSKVYDLPYPPTAENLARYLYQVSGSLLARHQVNVVKIRCWETPNCYADYEEP